MRQIKAKVTALQHQYAELQKQRQQDIAQFITALELSEIDDETLLGGLLYIKDKTSVQDPLVEVWQQAGERFLRRSKHKSQHSAKQAATPSAKPQSSQKSS